MATNATKPKREPPFKLYLLLNDGSGSRALTTVWTLSSGVAAPIYWDKECQHPVQEGELRTFGYDTTMFGDKVPGVYDYATSRFI